MRQLGQEDDVNSGQEIKLSVGAQEMDPEMQMPTKVLHFRGISYSVGPIILRGLAV